MLDLIKIMIKISKVALTQDVNNGLKREQIIAKYSEGDTKLPNSVLTTMLKECGLKIKKTRKPKFILVDNVELPGNTTELKEIADTAKIGNESLIEESAKVNSELE